MTSRLLRRFVTKLPNSIATCRAGGGVLCARDVSLPASAVELAKVLYPLPWIDAVEALVSKGYTVNKVAYLLSERLEVSHVSAWRYLTGKRRTIEIQQSILDISEDFYDVDSKTIKGYSRKQKPKPLSPEELEDTIVDAQLKFHALKLRDQGMTKREAMEELEISAVKLNSYLINKNRKLADKGGFVLSLLEDYDLTIEKIAEKTEEDVAIVLSWALCLWTIP